MARKPKIISIGFAVPKYCYTQRQTFDAFKYPNQFWRIFKGSEIDTRYYTVPLERVKYMSWQEQQDEYLKGVLDLSKQSILNCVDGRNTDDIGALIFSSCTGIVPGPVVGHYLAKELGLAQNTYITNITAQGCDGGFPGLRRAFDFTSTTNKLSLATACELCSCAYFPETDYEPDPENRYELLRSYAIFADASSSILVGFDDVPYHPTIIDTETYFNTDYLDELGFVWRDGRLRVRLSTNVPDIATELSEVAVKRLLEKYDLQIKDIKYWIIHPAGKSVLDKIRDMLGLPEEKITYSRESLRLYGNCSSSSIGIIGKMLIQQEKNLEGYLVVISIGPGMTSDATLLKFEK